MACINGRGQCAGLKCAGNCSDPPASPLYSIVFCFAGSLFAVHSPLRCIGRDTLILIFSVVMDVFRRIYRCLLLTVSTYFRGLVRLSAPFVMLRLAIVFFLSITLYVCSGDGHSAKQKAHAFLPCESIY
jgi:hypothetical protein